MGLSSRNCFSFEFQVLGFFNLGSSSYMLYEYEGIWDFRSARLRCCWVDGCLDLAIVIVVLFLEREF